MQNLLERRLGQRWALLTTAVLFGLSHFNKRAVHFNWRYVLLAALAGIFYGRAWRQERRVGRRLSRMRPSIRFGRFGCDDVTRDRGFGWVRESGRASHDAHISKSRYGAPDSVDECCSLRALAFQQARGALQLAVCRACCPGWNFLWTSLASGAEGGS